MFERATARVNWGWIDLNRFVQKRLVKVGSVRPGGTIEI